MRSTLPPTMHIVAAITAGQIYPFEVRWKKAVLGQGHGFPELSFLKSFFPTRFKWMNLASMARRNK
jgi:hypothetical protein